MPNDTQEEESAQGHEASWLAEFNAQLSAPGVRSQLNKYASRRARMVAKSERRVGSQYAEDLVQDAIGDTWMGSLTWNPGRISLANHLLGAIRSRSRHDYTRANRCPHERFNPAEEGDAVATAVEASLSAARSALPRAELVAVASRALRDLRRLTHDDADILLLLDACAEGATTKADLMRISGLSDRRYKMARQRLDRRVMDLPNAVLKMLR